MDEKHLVERISLLYGEIDWSHAIGLLHVTAIAERGEAVLAIGPDAPSSATDRFVLGFARARADLILTTGAILRSEPALRHDYAEDEEMQASFRAWRRNLSGAEESASLIVISRSGDFDVAHPALRAAIGGMVWTSKAGRRKLGPRVGRLSVEVGISDDAKDAKDLDGEDQVPSLGRMLRVVRSRFEARTILLEAGPTIAREFYRTSEAGGPRVEELLLSRFEGELASAALGPRFEPLSKVSRHFRGTPTSVCFEEPSGVWRFERYRDVTKVDSKIWC